MSSTVTALFPLQQQGAQPELIGVVLVVGVKCLAQEHISRPSIWLTVEYPGLGLVVGSTLDSPLNSPQKKKLCFVFDATFDLYE